jgi:hypothetical protein
MEFWSSGFYRAFAVSKAHSVFTGFLPLARPARTFGDVRVALFPRAQMPVLRPVPVISAFHSFLSALLHRDDGEFLYPKRVCACESCSSFIFAIAFFGFIPREP